MAILVGNCRMCGVEQKIQVQDEDLEKYQRGAKVQHAFPYLSPGDREFIISQHCNACFNRLFPEED
jgi:hypothetical protein